MSWGPSQTADTYLLQVQKYDIPATPAATSAPAASAPVPVVAPVGSPKSPVLPGATPATQAITLVSSPTASIPASPLAAAAKVPGGFGSRRARPRTGGFSSPLWFCPPQLF